MSNEFDLSGKKAIVTGAGGGLGAAIAIAMARNGADVALWGRQAEPLHATAASVKEYGSKAVVQSVDVTEVNALSATLEAAADMLGGLDILVNNAGWNHPALAVDVTEDVWDRILNVNLKGTFFSCQAMARHLLAAGHGGRIINISSCLGLSALDKRAPYLASKGGVNQLTRGLALEWSGAGITVNAVAPAIVETAMTEKMGTAGRVHPKMLLGRLIQPSEIGSAVVFLASDAAAMITGQVLYVDGGWTIH